MDSSSEPSSSENSHTISLSSASFLSDSGRSVQHDALGDLRSLFNVLYVNSIPGPNLVRIKKEFNLCTGEGGEGTIYEASLDFASNLTSIPAEVDGTTKARIGHSARAWRSCVIKQLRSDGDRHLAFQVYSAFTEIKILSQQSFIQNPNIVTLLGWALCLDSLESLTSSIPRLPLLILEKAQFDLKSFLNSVEYERSLHSDLCAICLGIGKGLQALHSENISHGDMKPANVLIFDGYAGPSKDYRLSGECWWTLKLCDFGLTTKLQETARLPNKLRYRGTEGWRPPESYAESPPKSLQLCDIFAYGLVVWCIFIGYQKASQSIRTVYDLIQGDIHLTLAELMDGAINIASELSDSKWSFRTRRKVFLEMPRDIREEQINRALIVLRESLNDDPARRNFQPWNFMDIKHFQSIGPVQDPEKFFTQLKADRQSQILHNLFKSCSTVVSRMFVRKDRTLRWAMHMYTRKRRRIIRSLMEFVSIWMPWLIPQNPQQQIYDRIYSKVESTFRDEEARRKDSRFYSFGPSNIDLFEHEDGDKCHNLVYFYNLLSRALGFQNEESHRSLTCLDASVLYSFARIRSRIKICCWRQYSQNPFILDQSMDSSHPPGALAMRQEVSMLMFVLCRKDFETLAWFCRGEVAKHVSQGLQKDPELLWGWIRVHYSDPHHSTEIVTLLLENGWNIGQQLLFDQCERSAFNWYLKSLPLESGILALSVCHQFRRIAADENATDLAKFYLTGQSPDLRDGEPINEQDLVTTALHDAVMVSNYEVVEYLVRTNFIVSVRDGAGRTGLQLAENLARHISNDTDAAKHIKTNQIIALLRQSKTDHLTSYGLHPDRATTLPLGWEEVKLAMGSVYRETSIDSEADPLTFIKPRAGLLQDKRLALAQRKFAGSGQAYYLDPLRFMHTKWKASGRVESASEPTYSDVWYLREVQNVAKPPSDPLTDERLWYRIVLRVSYFLTAVAGTTYSFIASMFSPYRFALVLLIALLAYEAWTSFMAQSPKFTEPGTWSDRGIRSWMNIREAWEIKTETCPSAQSIPWPTLFAELGQRRPETSREL